jgi:eukaryotic-like serine/threonine-protein kinase
MGIVYEAHDPAIDRKVAIKLIRADLLNGEERQNYIERFQREAQAAGRCNHPGIVAIFDFALHEGNPFLAMEYVEGLGLDRVLAHGERFTPAAAVQFILQVLDALACAHALGIVHRDIKPSNVLIMSGGRIKVMDFGIARIDNSDLTHAGTAIGTPSYMSPEQCRGGAVDLRTDLFSVATVLQELLIGQRPFPGKSFTEVVYSLLNEPPSAGSALADVAGPRLSAVLHQALAKRPEDRFPSADAMADAIRQAVGGAAVQSAPLAVIDKTVMAVRARESAVPPPGRAAFDQVLLSGIERRFAQHVGPIARYLMHRSMRTATSVQDLCNALAQRIDQPDDRRQFLADALESTRTGLSGSGIESGAGPTLAGPPPLPASPVAILPDERERAQQALAKTLGPIARILVQRALGLAQTREEFWDLLAAHIGPTAERAAFLRERDGG